MKNIICTCGLEVTKIVGEVYKEANKEYQDTTIACPKCKAMKTIKKRGNIKGLLIK